MVISVKMDGFQAHRMGASGARIMRRNETAVPIYPRFPFSFALFNPRFEQHPRCVMTYDNSCNDVCNPQQGRWFATGNE